MTCTFVWKHLHCPHKIPKRRKTGTTPLLSPKHPIIDRGFPPPPPISSCRIAANPSNRRLHPFPPPALRRWGAEAIAPGLSHAMHVVTSREALLPSLPRCPRHRSDALAPHPRRSLAVSAASTMWCHSVTSEWEFHWASKQATSEWEFHWASKQATSAATGTRGCVLGASWQLTGLR